MTRICLMVLCATGLLIGRAEADILTLQECLKKAASANHELKVSAYDEKLAAQDVAIARSGYLPRLDLHGGYAMQQDPQAFSVLGLSMKTQQKDYGYLSMAAEQTLYDFGRTSARYDRALALRDAASLNYTAREKDVFLQVVEAYYGILEYGNFLKSAEEEVIQMTDHLRVAKNLYEQGVVTRNDLLQAEVQLADSRQRKLAEGNRLANGWLYLNYLTGQQPGHRADLEATVGVEKNGVEAGGRFDPANRAEVKALRQGIRADELTIKEVRSYYFPEIFARLGMDYVQNNKVVEQTILTATVGVRVNLFDGLATTSRYRQAVQARSQAEEKLSMTEALIRLEYETADNDARIALERIRTAETAVKSGEENLRINKNRYQEHVGTATDVIDAQTLLSRTRTEYHRAVFDYQVAVARIKKAKGEL
ncbi:MAG: TolC family protein [Geobacteraceae bacterium]|nr:TolC family protein [Geobacteraceae bacterium]